MTHPPSVEEQLLAAFPSQNFPWRQAAVLDKMTGTANHKTPATQLRLKRQIHRRGKNKQKIIMNIQSRGKLQTWDLILCESQAVNLLSQALSYHPPLPGQNQAFAVGGWARIWARMPSARQQKDPLWWKPARAWNTWNSEMPNVRAWILTALQRSSSPSPCGAQSFPSANPTASEDLDAAPEWPALGTQRLNLMRFRSATTGCLHAKQ